MGCIAGIVETGGRTAATPPREFEDGGEDRTGPGARGRLERVGQLRCRVSFNDIFYLSKPSVMIPEVLAAHRPFYSLFQ